MYNIMLYVMYCIILCRMIKMYNNKNGGKPSKRAIEHINNNVKILDYNFFISYPLFDILSKRENA